MNAGFMACNWTRTSGSTTSLPIVYDKVLQHDKPDRRGAEDGAGVSASGSNSNSML